MGQSVETTRAIAQSLVDDALVTHTASGTLLLDHGDDTDARFPELALPLAHDERGGPFVILDDGSEDQGLLVSRTDEELWTATLFVRPAASSPICGVGIDLASLSDFRRRSFADRFVDLILTDRDRSLARTIHPESPDLGFAYAFSAKEAAFKACAAPLRRWYEQSADELCFDIRSFQLCDETHEDGTARHAHAKQAMDQMRIQAIELHHASLEDMVLTLALALK